MFISQTTDFHFTNYRFSFRKLQIFSSRTSDFHFVSFHFVLFGFVSQSTIGRALVQTSGPSENAEAKCIILNADCKF